MICKADKNEEQKSLSVQNGAMSHIPEGVESLCRDVLKEEFASLVLLVEVEAGLREILAGHRVSNDKLLKALL